MQNLVDQGQASSDDDSTRSPQSPASPPHFSPVHGGLEAGMGAPYGNDLSYEETQGPAKRLKVSHPQAPFQMPHGYPQNPMQFARTGTLDSTLATLLLTQHDSEPIVRWFLQACSCSHWSSRWASSTAFRASTFRTCRTSSSRPSLPGSPPRTSRSRSMKASLLLITCLFACSAFRSRVLASVDSVPAVAAGAKPVAALPSPMALAAQNAASADAGATSAAAITVAPAAEKKQQLHRVLPFIKPLSSKALVRQQSEATSMDLSSDETSSQPADESKAIDLYHVKPTPADKTAQDYELYKNVLLKSNVTLVSNACILSCSVAAVPHALHFRSNPTRRTTSARRRSRSSRRRCAAT